MKKRTLSLAFGLALFGASAATLGLVEVLAQSQQDPFALAPWLTDQALFSCTDVTVNGNSTIDSLGVDAGAAGSQGHVVADGNVTLNGNIQVKGDVTAGPGKHVVKNGNVTITGAVGNLSAARSCTPVDLATIAPALKTTNDNARIPYTQGGKDPLQGPAHTDFKVVGNDSITLRSGTYYFTSFDVNGSSVVRVSGLVRILVAGPVTVNGQSKINDNQNAFNLRLWSSGSSFTIDGGSNASAFAYAPSAQLAINGGSAYVGGLFANRIDVDGGSQIARALNDFSVATIAITEGANALADGSSFGRNVTPVYIVTGGTPFVTVNATLDGAAFASGTTVSTEGVHRLTVSVDDAAGRHVEKTVTFTIVRSSAPPVLTIDQPPLDGACRASGPPIAVSGRVGQPGTSGARPAVTLVVKPSAGTPQTFPATLDAAGTGWSVAGVDLGSADGMATLTASTTDALGHDAHALRTVRVKASTPAVLLLLDGGPFPGSAAGTAAGSGEAPFLFGRVVSPRALVSDGPDSAPPSAVLTLDGAPWAGGTIATEGNHFLVATATDCAGHSSATHALFTIDVTPPRLLSTTPRNADSLGSAPASFTGASDPDLATATVNGVSASVASGAFTLAPFSWKDGSNTVAIGLVDRAGNRATYSVAFTVKTLGPSLEILESGLPIASGATFFRAVTPVVRSNDPSATVAATLNGAPFVSGTPVSAAGSYALAATATDALGHSGSASASFTIDLSAAPAIDITAPADGAVLAGPAIAVTGTASASVTSVTVNGRAATLAGATWSLPDLVLPTDVSAEIIAIGADARGRTATATRQVTVRASGPQILILDPPDGSRTNRRKIDVSGAVVGGPSMTANGTVAVAGATARLDALGTFRAKDVPLADGVNTLTASAVDPQGRTGIAHVTVTADTVAPLIAISADGQLLAEGASFARAFSLRVEITDNTAPLPIPVIRLNGQDRGATAAVTDIAISQNGGYVLSVIARDVAGNESRADRSFVLASGGCSVSGLDPADGTVVAAPAVSLHGKSGDAQTVKVTVGGQTFTAQLADGTFAAGGVPLPAVGDNTIQIACTDRAGATTTTNLKLTRLADGPGPVVRLTAPANGARQSAATLAVAGTVSDPSAAVTVNGVKALVAPGGTFSLALLPLVEGPNIISARALDAAGRLGEDRVVAYRDSAAPKISITSPSDGAHVGQPGAGAAAVTVTGAVDLTNEPNLASVVVASAAGSVTATVDPDSGAFVAAGVPLVTSSPGTSQTLTATATDTLSQAGSASVSVVFDPAAPALVLSQPIDLTRYTEASPPSFAAAGEAWAKDGAQISLNGGGLDPASATWDAPAADGRRHAAFSAQVTVPSAEGPFGLIARVEEPSGAYANSRRFVFMDVTAPTALELSPADGAKQVDANEILLALFSESVKPSSLPASDGLTLTRVATGDKTVGTFTIAGNAVAFVPGAALVRGEVYVFRAGAGVKDLAGHPLAAAKESRFTVAALATGVAPVLDAIPAVTCATQLAITGAAVPNAAVRLRDGDLTFTGNADGAGRFSITIPLSGNGFHAVHATVLDRDGAAASPEVTVLFRVDCSAPSVSGATLDRASGKITVGFSEAMGAASLSVGGTGSAITVSKADDATRAPQAAALTLSADGATAALDLGSAPDAWWRNASVRLSVGPPGADASGNALGAAFETVFFASGSDLSDGFLSGEAYDDENGRPLAGADVRLFTSGAALPGSVPATQVGTAVASTVTDGRGRFSLAGDVVAGRYALVLSRSNYSRAVRRLALEPAVGAVPFDSRLTPLGAQAPALLVPSAGGSFAGPAGSGLSASFAPGALASSVNLGVRLTALSGQGLPEPLPLGWTPLAAAELRLIPNGAGEDALAEGVGTPFSANAVQITLTLPAGVPSSADLYAARYDVAAGAWLALPIPVRASGAGGTDTARVALAGPGAVAVILADVDPATRPPVMPVSLDAPLVGVALSSGLPTLTAAIGLDPAIVSPTGRATARVVAKSSDGTTPWPSGLAVQAYLDEKLILAGGGELYEAPFSSDLVLYHPPLAAADLGNTAPGAAGSLTFRISPSPRAAQVLLDTGYENVRLFPFTEQLERGQVLGPAGGSVSSADGVELFVPESGLAQKTVVRARLLSSSEFSALPVPAGFSLVAGVRVDLSGFSLARPATLKLNAPAGLPADAADDPRLVLASFVDQPGDGRGAFARVIGRVSLLPAAGSAPARLVGAPEVAGSTLPLSGITGEGVFLLLHANATIGFATGRVTAPNGSGYAGSRVTAQGLGTADLSQPGGLYAVPAPAGTPTLLALHPALGVSGTAQIPSLAKGQIAQLDIVVAATPPQILSLQPARGAADQLVGTSVAVLFSAALDPASVLSRTLQVSLADANGLPTGLSFTGSVSLSPDKTTIVFTPAHPLPPGRRIAARFTGGVRDSVGTAYGGALPVDWTFTTSTQFVTGGAIHPEKIRLLLPVSGVAQVIADPGAIPVAAAGTTPWSVWADVENAFACPSVATIPADSAGGFSLNAGCPPTAAVTLASRVWLHVIDPTGAEAATFKLGPFTTPDGKGFVAPPGEATVFTTAEGIEVTAPAAAFDVPTLVKITKQPLDSLAVALNPDLEMGAVVSVDFDGTAKETLRLRIPVTTASPVGGLVFAGTPIDLPWGRKLKILDVGRLVDDGKGGKLISTLEADQPEDPADASSRSGAANARAFAGRRPQAVSKELIGAILAESTARGTMAFVLGASIQLSAMTGSIMPAFVGANSLVLYSSLVDAMVFAPFRFDARYILPAIPGKSFTLVARDASTGWVINSADYGPINPDTARYYDLKTFPDGRGPIPLRIVDAYPFRLYSFRAPEDGQNLSLEIQLEARASGGSTSLGVLAPPFPKGTSLDLFNLGQGTSAEAQGDLSAQVLVPSTPGDELLAVVGPADLEPDTFLTRPLSLNFNLAAQVADGDLPFVAQLRDCGPIDTFSGCGTGASIPLKATLTAAKRTLELVPPGLLPRGHVFLLVPDKSRIRFVGTQVLVDWPPELPQRFWLATRTAPPAPSPEVQAFSALGDTDSARDLLKFGNILLVGSATGNLLAIDVSRTADAVAAPAPFAFLSPSAASQVRAFATDGHNRLFLNELEGASWAVKAVRVEDVWAATPEKCAGGPPSSGWQKDLGCFSSAVGGVKVAFAIGGLSGVSPSEFLGLAGSLPTGTPAGMQVLVDDLTVPEDGESWQLADFAARFGLTGTAPDAAGFFDFEANVQSVRGVLPQPTDSVCHDEPYYKWQRISVDNLSTGQVFSADAPVDGDARIAHVRGRVGDRIRVRFNRKALGYVAIVGSGISVVDLNRLYGRLDLTSTQANKSQCGRRLARYEAADIPIYTNAAVPKDRADSLALPRLDGLTNTPALAVSVGGPDIRVDSVLTHYGSVHATSAQVTPEALAITPTGPPDDWKTPADVRFLKTLLPQGVGPAYRDVLFAPSVAWIDRGIVGADGGRFSNGYSACVVKPCEKKGPLLFYSLGTGGIATFDASGDDRLLVGRFKARGHSVFRLAIDPSVRRLFAGGTDDKNNTIIDVWDLARVSGGPTPDGLDASPAAEPDGDPRLIFSLIAPWDTNHLGFDESGDGLVYTWGSKSVGGAGGVTVTTGGFALPFDDLSFTFAGVYRDPSSPPSSSGQPGIPVVRPAAALRPLGVSSRTTAAEERTSSDNDEKVLTPAFKLRVALPGALAPVLKARVQSLRSLPDRSLLDKADVGAAPAPPGGKGWPDPFVVVTLRRLGTDDVRLGDGKAATGGRLSNAYNLYESDEVVVLVADPRAAEGYRDTLKGDQDDSAGEGAACRRCRLPSYLDLKTMKLKDLLAAGPYLRAHLFVENALGDAATQGAIDWFQARREAYPAPRGTIPVDAWADAVPSPAQVTLAEPALNPAVWQGEAGLRVALGPGEALFDSTDFAAAGRGVDFAFDRSYRSGMLGFGPLGAAGWSSNLFAHLRFIPPVLTSASGASKTYSYLGEAQYHDGHGRVLTFYPACEKDCPPGYATPPGITDGRMCPPDTELDPGPASAGQSDQEGTSYCVQKGVYLHLQQLENGRAYRIVSRTHSQLYFNADGSLAEVSDRFRREPKGSAKRENTLRLSYDGTRHLVAAEDDYGRRYSFEYERDPQKATYGLLTSMKDFGKGGAQRRVEYGFDTADPETRLLRKVRLPQVEALPPGQTDPVPMTPEIAYEYVSSPPSASAPLHDKLGNARLKSIALPKFLELTVPRVTIDYDPSTARVKTVTVPNTKGVLALHYGFDASPAPSHPFLAATATVTPPWGRVLTYTLTPEGRISTFENGSAVPTFLAPTPAAGFPSTSLVPVSRTPKTTWDYEADGKLKSVVAPDGGGTNLFYEGSGTRFERATPTRIVRTTGAAAAGLSSTSATVEVKDFKDNLPRELAVEMETGSFHKLLLDVPGDPGVTTDVDYDVGWTADGQTIKVKYDKYGQRTESANPDVTGAPKVAETYLSGEDGTPKTGFPEETTLGDSVKWTNTYDDKRGNPARVSTTNGGAVTEYTYDAWGRVKSAAITRSLNADVFRKVPAQAEQAFDAAGHLVRERRQQGDLTVEAHYEYDGRERLVKVTRTQAAAPAPAQPLREVVAVENEWDQTTGLLASVTSGQGTAGDVAVRTRYRYEANTGRVAAVFEEGSSGNSGQRLIAYDVMDRPVFRTDGDHGASWTEYDGLGRAFREALPTGAFVERKFDAMDHTLEETVFDFADDGKGGTQKRTLAKTATEWLPYGPKKVTAYLTSSETDFRTTSYAYDGTGRVQAVTSGGTAGSAPASPRTERSVTYEGNAGLVKTETDAAGNVTTYSYVAGSIWPETIERAEKPDNVTATERYAYDALGRVVDFTAGDGTHSALTYDESGNLTTHTVGNVARSFRYDGWGNLLDALGPAARAHAGYGWDALDRQMEKRVDGDGGRVDRTVLTYDDLGRLATRTRPQSLPESFGYEPDGMLNLWTTRFSAGGNPQLQFAFDYDPANRLVRRRVANPEVYRDKPPRGFRLADDADVTDFADGLSRLSRAALVTGSGSALGSGTADPATAVAFTGYDLRGLPGRETVGSAGAGLDRRYDVWGNATQVDLPSLVSAIRTYKRAFDDLDRLTRVDALDAGGPILGFGMKWAWAGTGRLSGATSLGPVGLAHALTYASTSPVRLNSLALGTSASAFGSFSYDWEVDADFKRARKVLPSGQRFVSGLAWSYARDEARRLSRAVTTAGDWAYGYGPADEFTSVIDTSAGTTDRPTSGPEGRIEKKGSTTFSYDAEARRVEDSRFFYTWDFRSRLVRVESKLPATEGEVVDYAYDALGRLLTRTYRGALPSGSLDEAQRPFKAKRGYLWDGDTLLAETSYAFDDTVISRKDHVPGPGPDQTYQIKSDGRTFSLFKDEQGNPLGLFEENSSGRANLLARFLYTPYGDLHLEMGPELRKAEFNPAKATLGPLEQTTDDTSLAGWLELTTTIALAPSSYDALKVETYDPATNAWKDVSRAELVIGTDKIPELLVVFRVAGWKKNTSYRVHVTTGLKDDFSRSLQLPDDVTLELQIPLDTTDVAPIYLRNFPLTFDTAKSAANELGGAFQGGLSLGFTGAVADPLSGLLYLRNRWYDPGIGIWLSQDPLGDVDSPNLYGFVAGRPHERTDPLGLAGEIPEPAQVGWTYRITGVVDGGRVAYVGSTVQELKDRLGRHKWNQLMRSSTTKVEMMPQYANVNVGASRSGTLRGAKSEAVRGPEQKIMDETRAQIEKANSELGPGEKPGRMLNEIRAAKEPKTLIERHGVKTGETSVLKAPGSSLILPSLFILTTATSAYNMTKEQKFSWRTYTLTDEFGEFTLEQEEYCFSCSQYKIYVSGKRKGQREGVTAEEFRRLRREAEALWGTVDWKLDFVPGALNRELPGERVD